METALQFSHLNSLNYYLETLANDDLHDIVSKAAWFGALDVFQYLEKQVPNKLQSIIETHFSYYYNQAAQSNQLDILKYLEQKAPKKLEQMIEANKYFDGFFWAAYHGHLDILIHLTEKAPEKLEVMATASNFSAFREAASQKKLQVVKFLAEKIPHKLNEMLAASEFYALRYAAANNGEEVIQYLLSYPSTFAYAESHTREYNGSVWDFMMRKLSTLRTQQQEAEATNLDTVFDVASDEEAKLLFYIARNLIRRNDTILIDDLHFLLGIPAVKALAHTAVTLHQQPNELLRLALSVGNQEATTVLLNIPAVQHLAEQSNYYRQELQGRFNLRTLAADRESAMTALTQGEQQQLQAMAKRYQPLLKQAGVDEVMSHLRNTLQVHYEAHPATISIQKKGHNKKLILPLEWKSFKNLHLFPRQKAQAFKAYYQNKAHTAWRYLSKPNPWMHQDASYVNINEARTERWSTFEEYQSLISLFYLAAIDKKTPCADEHTFETRLEHFIDELAYIGRAHNWDKSRLKNNGQQEQYDDLEGDRPSCFSGVKRRLFQSVLGHPLLKVLTVDVIQIEINEFLFKNFKKAINPGNRFALKKAWDKGIEGEDLSEEDTKLIQSLNISLEQQQAFKKYLSSKYGPSFATNLSFTRQVNNAFLLTSTITSHLFKHGSLMVEFFSKLQTSEEQGERTTLNPQGFFAAYISQTQNTEAPASSLAPKQ
ncbi:hypothetical protein Lsan_2700 [Legionella santicrucis]|uniref:Ankyrin repeat protein n=1 Tax=Legionella santicrucis TaxID=45074 RepID=A0A0W0YHZ5_9GAMM|nr:ankyrin repeat domain-containing protein [Legionella santicrucis]KTD56540.1 hypothetical protein Lsan_2700 [Legionella santicrucis]